MPDSRPPPDSPTGAPEPADPAPADERPAPRDISGLIGPTLVGLVAGVTIILLVLWLT